MKNIRILIVGITLIAFCSILFVGTRIYRNQKAKLTQNAKIDLTAIADLKVKQIVDWRTEKKNDAAFFVDNFNFVSDAETFLKNKNQNAKDQLLIRMMRLKKHFSYSDILYIDRAGIIRLSTTGRTVQLHKHALESLFESIKNKEIILTNLHRGPGEIPAHIGVIAPLYSGNTNIGAIFIIIEGNQYLYPLIQSWPTPSKTSETLIVTQQGDSVLFLNELRHRSNTALNFKIPMSQSDLPAAMALSGKTGLVHGIDYRGKKVVAVLNLIPDSNWYMITKIDEAELFENTERVATFILFSMLTLLVVVGAAALAIYQRYQKKSFREKFYAEQLIRQSREIYRVTLESIGDAVIATDHGGNIQFMNKVAEELTGWNLKECEGKPLTDVFRIINELNGEAADNPVLKVLQTRSVVGMANHTLLIQKDGNQKPIADSGAPIRDDEGKITGVVLVFRDQTGERQKQKEMDDLNRQLAQAQKMEAVGRLAGGVAHDFNNMLNVIHGRAEIALEECEGDGRLIKHLQEIKSAAQRSAEITSQLLAFARKQTIEPKVINFNTSVEKTIKMLKRLIGEDIDLAWLPGNDLWNIKMDPTQLDQVLANLAVNARDAIDGVGKVTIETENVHISEEYCHTHEGFNPGDFVMLAFSDNGCGMDPQTQTMIFEPFFTTKSKGKGTGLGLATVFGIIKQNDGFINLYSEPGNGTTFKIYIPRSEQTISQSDIMEKPETPKSQGETVLVVEDEAMILNLSRSFLEKLGYRVLTANTTTEALNIAENYDSEIHLVISDVVMPEMDGKSLVNEIKKFRPKIHPLFMSGYTANVIAHRGVLDEGVAFIQKPFNMDSLGKKIREVMEN